MREPRVVARLFLIALVFNLCWLPTHLRSKALAETVEPVPADCYAPEPLWSTHEALWEHMGWTGLTRCDLLAIIDQDITECAPEPPDPRTYPKTGHLGT